MDTLQNELEAEYPDLPISIIGVNRSGGSYASGNPLAAQGRDIPWLQDTVEQDVWSAWEVGFRDVIIVDADGVYYGTYNLTSNNLSNADNFDSLRDLLLTAAGYLE